MHARLCASRHGSTKLACGLPQAASHSLPTSSLPAGKWVGRSDAAIMDAPLRAHWRKLGLWLLLEGILLALTVVVKADPAEFVWDPSIPDCHDQAWNCQFSGAQGGSEPV